MSKAELEAADSKRLYCYCYVAVVGLRIHRFSQISQLDCYFYDPIFQKLSLQRSLQSESKPQTEISPFLNLVWQDNDSRYEACHALSGV